MADLETPTVQELAIDTHFRWQNDAMFHARVYAVSQVLNPESNAMARATRELIAIVLHTNDELVKRSESLTPRSG